MVVVVFLPVVVLWVFALVDLATRKDISRRRRIVVTVIVVVVFPLTLVYLLARAPQSARRGPQEPDDPRAPLVEALEDPSAHHSEWSMSHSELRSWIRGSVQIGAQDR